MNKKIMTILGIALLVVIAGSFWFVKNSGEQKTKSNVIPTKVEESQNVQNTNASVIPAEAEIQEEASDILYNPDGTIDTSNWQTYRNEEYGFEVKYPEDWVIKKQRTNSIVVSFNSLKNEKLLNKIKKKKVYGEDYMDDVSIYFWSSVLEEDENKYNHLQAVTVEDLVSKNDMISKVSEISINHTKAYEVIRYGFGAYYAIIMEHNKHLYQIMFGNVESQNKLTSIHKSIINSFRFIK